MRAFLALSMVFVVAQMAFAAEPATPDAIASRFFEALSQGDEGKAVDGFFASNPAIHQKTEALQTLKAQVRKVFQLYGTPFATEVVVIEDLTPSLQRRVYITKHDVHPVTWEMYFYKPRTIWVADQLVLADQYQVIDRRK